MVWGKLTKDERLKTKGWEQKLAGLIQERYTVTHDKALRQAKHFFAIKLNAPPLL